MRLSTIAISMFIFSTAFAAPSSLASPYETQSLTQLIDDLVNIDAETAGLHGTGFFNTFIAEDAAAQFEGGVLGSVAPKRFPQMVELVRRGASSLPLLIGHLDDRRPTKLVVSSMFGSHFGGQFFGDEYDPKVKSSQGRDSVPGLFLGREFNGPYTARVGDVCYALIGQIVNRALRAIRYQPSAIMIVNSPIEAPKLVLEVKEDWSGIGSDGLLTSLLADARAGRTGALERIRFYYPKEYELQRAGDLRLRIDAFEAVALNKSH
jgi:hypothetical protein